MHKIAKFAVDNPVTVLMLVLGIMLLGFISLGKLGIDLFPDLNSPKIYIEFEVGEAPPEEIEKNYIDQIESLAMRQSDVTNVSSTSKNGSATVTVEYNWKKDMDEAFLDLQKELNSFAQNNNLDNFTISQYDPNASPVMVVALKNDNIQNMDELRIVAQNYIRNELIRIDGIADIRLAGDEESEVVIETNNYLLEAYGLSPSDIAQQIRSYNMNVSGGSIVNLGTRYTIKGVSVLENINDLEDIIVTFKESAYSAASASSPLSQSNPSGASTNNSSRTPVYLKDVATISYSNKEPDNMVTINGERCIGLSIYKEPLYNTVQAVESLNKAFEEISRALPGYEFTVVEDQGSYIGSAVGEVKNTLLIGILLAVIVLYVFLRRVGTTLVISIAIPISIVATFNLMYFSHLTLNIMTLGGLALGAGMLVDNAIVVLENIIRLHDSGMSYKDSIIEGTSQVGGAITASTLTTIVVFLPIVYLNGASGELFKDMAWTVAFALLSSLFVALLVIPMLMTVFFKKSKSTVAAIPVTHDRYSNLLENVIDNRWKVIVAIVVLMGGCLLLIPQLGSEFMPKSESNQFTIGLTLPSGTGLERTYNTAINTENIIKELLGDKVEQTYLQAGDNNNTSLANSNQTTGENTASITVILGDDFTSYTEEAISLINSHLSIIPDIEVSYTRKESALQTTLGTTESPFILEISGEDFSELDKILNESKELLSGIPELYNITTSLDEGVPEVEIVVDRFKASYYNVTASTILSQISNFLQGSEAGSFEKDGEMKDITIKLEDVSLHQLQEMKISAGSTSIPLSELAAIKIVNSPRNIIRRNQTRTCYVYADVAADASFNQVVNAAQKTLESVVLPVNYKMEITGEELKRQESMSNLTFALLLSLALVFMVLAAQFESLLQPFIIMLTIPFAAMGTIITFFVLGKSLNMMAYIGIIMLAGIAVNDATILIDRINQLRSGGLTKRDAIIQAGCQRLRPIIMTTLTTILALLPLTIGIGESASLRAPMALAVISGLVTSTILTLIVIPCIYWILTPNKQ